MARLAIHRTTRWSTSVELVVTDPGPWRPPAVAARRQLDRIEEVASRFRPDSEISRLHDVPPAPDRRPVRTS